MIPPHRRPRSQARKPAFFAVVRAGLAAAAWITISPVASADPLTTAPVWFPLTPPYVSGPGLVYVPTQDALYQIGGDVPPDYAPYGTLHEVKGGLWVWPLSPAATTGAWSKGPIAALSQTPGVPAGQFVYEPQGNRILRLAPDVRLRQHDVAATTASFTTIVPVGTPPPEDGPIAFDADSARVLLVTRGLTHPEPVRVFALATTPRAEAWDELVSYGAPASLSTHAHAVYDSIGQRLVVLDAGRPVGVTRVYALSLVTRAWSELAVANAGAAPANWRDYAMTMDPAGRRAFVFGGRPQASDVATAQMWQLDLGEAPAWSVVPGSAGEPPESRWSAGLAWDPGRGRVWMCGGQTAARFIADVVQQRRSAQLWFNPLPAGPGAESWRMSVPPALPRTLDGAATAVDAANDRFFVHGGGIALASSTRALSDSLWVVPFAAPTRWTLLSGGQPSPVRRRDGDLMFDATRGELWALGGNVNLALGALRRLRLADAPAWETIVPSPGLPVPPRGRAVLDPVRDRLLSIAPADGGPAALVVHALPLGGATYGWSPLAVDSLPPALLREYTATVDPIADRVLVVGGMQATPDAGPGAPTAVASDSVFALDLAVDPPAWRRLPPIPGGREAVGRRNHVAAIAANQRFLLVAGGDFHLDDGTSYGVTRMRGDTWYLSLREPYVWILQGEQVPQPRPRAHALGVFDPARQDLLYGGGSSFESLDGTTWTEAGYTDDLWLLGFSGYTPTRLDLVEAVADPGGGGVPPAIRVRFAGEGPSGEVRVERTDDDDWRDVGAAVETTPGLYEFTDRDVVRGVAYRYRGRWFDDGVVHVTAASAPVALPVDAGDGVGLALRPRGGSVVRAWPLELEVALAPGAGAATLELVDVRGRVIARQRVEAAGVVRVAPAQAPGAGLYFVRLGQGAASVTVRVVRL